MMTRRLDFGGSADQVALAATGREFGLAWVGSRKPRGTAVYLQRIGLDGAALEPAIEVTDGVPLTCGRPDIVWAGDGYAIVWHDDRAQTGSEVFFSFVECGEEPALVTPVNPEDSLSEPDAGADGGDVPGDIPSEVPAEDPQAPPSIKSAF